MSITASRADLAQVLADDKADEVTVYEYVPAAIAAPALFIEPGSPMLDAGDPAVFGHYRVRWTITAVAEVGDNDKTTNDLDKLLDRTVQALAGAYHVEQIGQPYVYQANTALHLAADLTVTDTITFKEN